uniref:Putative secreted protein n=1 Tax=Amblyomma americanum TaxID=6943 RepID=A0A0C9SCU0_AMBAM
MQTMIVNGFPFVRVQAVSMCVLNCEPPMHPQSPLHTHFGTGIENVHWSDVVNIKIYTTLVFKRKTLALDTTMIIRMTSVHYRLAQEVSFTFSGIKISCGF